MPLLTRLYLSTILANRTVILLAAGLPVLAYCLPQLVPATLKPSLIEPARAQAGWILLWTVCSGWLFLSAASTGEEWRRNGFLVYAFSREAARFRRLRLIAGSTIGFSVPAILFVFGTFLTSVVGALPGDQKEAELWIILNLQSCVLYLTIVIPLATLGFSLATRFSSTVSWILVTGHFGFGFFFQGKLAPYLVSSSPPGQLLNLLGPHFHLADLTERLVFKMGPLPFSGLAQFLGYFAGWGLLTMVVAILLFRAKQ